MAFTNVDEIRVSYSKMVDDLLKNGNNLNQEMVRNAVFEWVNANFDHSVQSMQAMQFVMNPSNGMPMNPDTWENVNKLQGLANYLDSTWREAIAAKLNSRPVNVPPQGLQVPPQGLQVPPKENTSGDVLQKFNTIMQSSPVNEELNKQLAKVQKDIASVSEEFGELHKQFQEKETALKEKTEALQKMQDTDPGYGALQEEIVVLKDEKDELGEEFDPVLDRLQKLRVEQSRLAKLGAKAEPVPQRYVDPNAAPTFPHTAQGNADRKKHELKQVGQEYVDMWKWLMQTPEGMGQDEGWGSIFALIFLLAQLVVGGLVGSAIYGMKALYKGYQSQKAHNAIGSLEGRVKMLPELNKAEVKANEELGALRKELETLENDSKKYPEWKDWYKEQIEWKKWEIEGKKDELKSIAEGKKEYSAKIKELGDQKKVKYTDTYDDTKDLNLDKKHEAVNKAVEHYGDVCGLNDQEKDDLRKAFFNNPEGALLKVKAIQMVLKENGYGPYGHNAKFINGTSQDHKNLKEMEKCLKQAVKAEKNIVEAGEKYEKQMTSPKMQEAYKQGTPILTQQEVQAKLAERDSKNTNVGQQQKVNVEPPDTGKKKGKGPK